MVSQDIFCESKSYSTPKIAVYLFSDDKTMFALGNMVLQLKNYKFIDTILLYIESDNPCLIEKLSKLDNRIRFVDFSKDNIIDRLNFDINANAFIKKYGLTLFTRFFILNFLNEFDSIVILDSDLLIQRSFLDCIDFDYPIIYRPAGSISRFISDFPDNYLYPAGGFIVLNKILLKYDVKVDSFFDFLNKYPNVPHIDEVVFGLISQKYNLIPKILDDRYNCNPSNDIASEAAIIHGVSIFKFWTNPVTNYLYPDWNYYNKLWNDFCDKNNLINFKKTIKFQYNLTNSKLYLIPHLLTIQTRLINIHTDLHVFTSIKNNFVEVFINNIDKKFCFRIFTNPKDFLCTIKLVDLRESRCKLESYKNAFLKFKQNQSLSDFKFLVSEKIFSAESNLIHFEKLLECINRIYIEIKEDIVSYFCTTINN